MPFAVQNKRSEMKDTESALVPRTPIGGQAFLGLGAMGSRMAANLLSTGHDLTVWKNEHA